jgi:hypothetical protein
VYLTVLSRPPTNEELLALQRHAETTKRGKPGEAARDIVWALINSPEFLYRH